MRKLRGSSKSNQKWVINLVSEADAHWPTPHLPFLLVADTDPELSDLFRLHWEPHEKITVQNIAARLSSQLGTKYVARNIELDKHDVRRYSY